MRNTAWGKRVQEKRVQLFPHLRRDQFAHEIKIDYQGLEQYELGNMHGLLEEDMKKLAKALGFNVHEFLATAGRIDKELKDIILKYPKVLSETILKADKVLSTVLGEHKRPRNLN